MRGELKLAIFIAAVVLGLLFNEVVEHITGHRPSMGTGSVLGILLVKMWPGIILSDRSPQ